jgi:hypothetical protein
MHAIRTIVKSHSKSISIQIPDDMIDQELEIIILPTKKNDTGLYNYWDKDDLNDLSLVSLSTPIQDNEDYLKW